MRSLHRIVLILVRELIETLKSMRLGNSFLVLLVANIPH